MRPRAALAEVCAIQQVTGDRWMLCNITWFSGWLAMGRGDYRAAQTAFDEAARLMDALDTQRPETRTPATLDKEEWYAWVHYGWGALALATGDLLTAAVHFQHCLAFFQTHRSDPIPIVDVLVKCGYVAQQQGDYQAATHYLVESLEAGTRIGLSAPHGRRADGPGRNRRRPGPRQPCGTPDLGPPPPCIPGSVPRANPMSGSLMIAISPLYGPTSITQRLPGHGEQDKRSR